MRKNYTTKFIYHLKSLRYLIIGFLLFAVVFLVLSGGQIKHLDSNGLLFASVPILIMFAIPTFYLHLTYYFKNIGLQMTIDDISGKIFLMQNGREYLFKISNIKSVEQNLGIYYKNNQDFAGRRIVPWTPYGYLLLKFNNGSEFYITSLMIDIVNSPLEITHTYFRFFPYIKKSVDISERRNIADKDYENEISYYKSCFEFHTQEQLAEKIKNEKTYEKAAVEAARQLLKLKFDSTV